MSADEEQKKREAAWGAVLDNIELVKKGSHDDLPKLKDEIKTLAIQYIAEEKKFVDTQNKLKRTEQATPRPDQSESNDISLCASLDKLEIYYKYLVMLERAERYKEHAEFKNKYLGFISEVTACVQNETDTLKEKAGYINNMANTLNDLEEKNPEMLAMKTKLDKKINALLKSIEDEDNCDVNKTGISACLEWDELKRKIEECRQDPANTINALRLKAIGESLVRSSSITEKFMGKKILAIAGICLVFAVLMLVVPGGGFPAATVAACGTMALALISAGFFMKSAFHKGPVINGINTAIDTIQPGI